MEWVRVFVCVPVHDHMEGVRGESWWTREGEWRVCGEAQQVSMQPKARPATHDLAHPVHVADWRSVSHAARHLPMIWLHQVWPRCVAPVYMHPPKKLACACCLCPRQPQLCQDAPHHRRSRPAAAGSPARAAWAGAGAPLPHECHHQVARVPLGGCCSSRGCPSSRRCCCCCCCCWCWRQDIQHGCWCG
jgi:hypothetical protein